MSFCRTPITNDVPPVSHVIWASARVERAENPTSWTRVPRPYYDTDGEGFIHHVCGLF